MSIASKSDKPVRVLIAEDQTMLRGALAALLNVNTPGRAGGLIV